jgi:5-formyltetrahydrofolate cyclo-ligase
MSAPIPPDPAIAALKKGLRREARARRAAACGTGAGHAAEAVARHVAGGLGLAPGSIVAAYRPVGDELDPTPAVAALRTLGHLTCLPVVSQRHGPLSFRAWAPGDPLEDGVLGIPVPGTASPEVVPDALLVPIVGFDALGRRLGQGGGYYDRTLALRRAVGPPILAVGVAFSAQEFDVLPEESFDQRLDGIATERGLRWFGHRRPSQGRDGS